MEQGEGEYYTRMQRDDGSYAYIPMDGEGHGLYVQMNGKRYINVNKDGETEDLYVKMQSEDGSYRYVPMMGTEGDVCKIYEETKDRRPHVCPQVHQTGSDQYTSVDSDIYQNCQAGAAADDQEVYEDMDRNPEGQDNPEEVYTCMDMDATSNDIVVFNSSQSYYLKQSLQVDLIPKTLLIRTGSCKVFVLKL